jgi:hypothetical protein
VGGVCEADVPPVCDDGSVCTVDSCSGNGCVYDPIPVEVPETVPFVDIGCLTSVDLVGSVPSVGTASWQIVNAPGVVLAQLNATAVRATNITGLVSFRYSITFGSCWSSSADVYVKRYSQVSAPVGLESSFSIGCQSSFYLPSQVPDDGFGVWTVQQGFLFYKKKKKIEEEIHV